MEKENKGKFCGGCVWFYAEDTYGNGACHFRFGEIANCWDHCTVDDHYISHVQARHYLAVLRQANRWRRDPNVPAIHRMPQPTEVGKAIDFAVEFTKEFMKL